MDLKLSDLWTECPECHGQGHTKTVTVNTGALPSSREEIHDCNACKKTGGQVTPSGEAVLAFLKVMAAKGKLRLSMMQ